MTNSSRYLFQLGILINKISLGPIEHWLEILLLIYLLPTTYTSYVTSWYSRQILLLYYWTTVSMSDMLPKSDQRFGWTIRWRDRKGMKVGFVTKHILTLHSTCQPSSVLATPVRTSYHRLIYIKSVWKLKM